MSGKRIEVVAPRIDVAPLISVMATTPATIGEIRLGGIRRRTAAVLYALPTPAAVASGDEAGRAEFKATVDRYRTDIDLEQQRHITTRTIIRVCELLAQSRKAP